MLKYIATVWDRCDLPAANAATQLLRLLKGQRAQWRFAVEQPGLWIAYIEMNSIDPEVYTLKGSCGAVLGKIFSRPDSPTQEILPAKAVFDEQETSRVIASQGRTLVSDYWGAYVAFLRDELRDKTWVLRSPQGALPCLSMEYHKARIYFSFTPDIVTLGLRALTVNWTYVARHLTKVKQSGETGFNEITEVNCGECVEIGPRNVNARTRYWNPLSVALAHRIDDVEYATQAVRATVRTSVHAWARCYRNILLCLSGGLDSSALATCLKNAPGQPSVTCLNRFSPTGDDSDERTFARMAANSVEFSLVEIARDSSVALDRMLEGYVTERPQNYLGALARRFGRELELYRQTNAEVIFTGEFGDQLFYPANYSLIAGDYVHDFGLAVGLLKVAVTAATLEGESIWRVLASAISGGLRRSRWDPITARREAGSIIDEGVLRDLLCLDKSEVPWHSSDLYVPAGKQSHIYSLMNPDGYYAPYPELLHPQGVSPLLSQPIVELCLQIPTYIHSLNGWDREIERRAFESNLPFGNARRRAKGGQVQYTAEIYRRNYAFIRQMVMEGGLLQRGILHRQRLEQAFAGRGTGLLRGLGRVSRILNIEVWLSLAKQQAVRVAA
jgi:asparagine synthase (glutamine-hydrolysing)